MRTATLQKLVLLFLLFYFVMGVFARFSITKSEEGTYPFFSWSLYSYIPRSEQTEYTLLIHKIGNRTFSPPQFVQKMQGVVFGNLADYYHSRFWDVKSLGQAAELDNKALMTDVRKRLEVDFLDPHITYEVVKIRYNPIEFWRSGTVIDSQSLGTFTSGIYE